MPMWKLTVRRRDPNKMIGRDSPSVVLCAQFSDDTYREETCRRTWLQGKEECIGEERSTYTIGAQLFLINWAAAQAEIFCLTTEPFLAILSDTG